MKDNRKRPIRKAKRSAKLADGNILEYSVPDGQTWTVQHWKENGLNIRQIAEAMGISEPTVSKEIKIMKLAISADYDADKIRKSLGSLIPQSVQAVSRSLAAGDGQLGAKMLTGLNVLRAEIQVEQRFLNITGSEVIAQLFDLIRSDPEYMLMARQALLAEDSQTMQVSGPDNLPPAVQAERLRRAEAKKKHALSGEGHTPETQAAVPDIQEGSTPPVEAGNRVTVDDSEFGSGKLNSLMPAGYFDYGKGDPSGVADSVSKEGGLLAELDSEFANSSEFAEALAFLKSEVSRLEAIQAGKQVKRIELRIRPGEDD